MNGDSEWGQRRQVEQNVLVPVDIWGYENKVSQFASLQSATVPHSQNTMGKHSMESMSYDCCDTDHLKLGLEI